MCKVDFQLNIAACIFSEHDPALQLLFLPSTKEKSRWKRSPIFWGNLKVFIQIITSKRGDSLLKFTSCFPFRTLALLADDKSKISAVIYAETREKRSVSPSDSQLRDGWMAPERECVS